jgi:hypothetical protein
MMRRRDFVKSLLAASGALTCQPDFLRALPTATDAREVKRVLVMFKCHLDVGYNDTQAAVMRKYFDEYFPRAIQVATAMRQSSADRYVWTTGSWLLYEYLDHVSGEQRRRAEQAVAAGDLAWHALPFTWEAEIMDRSMIEGAIGLSQSLDRRFGRTTIAAKTSDVVGQSRGLVGPLAAKGVKLLDIGANDICTFPEVPPLFLWRDPEGASLVIMYHHHYGDTVRVPDSDLALSVQMLGDNVGPHSVDQITKIYADLRKQFPQAQISAANLSEMAAAVEPYRNRLPAVTQEIGDTWIYGVPSDPIKMARYREVARLRKEWLGQGKFRLGDSTDCALLRRLLLCVEHTWGIDTQLMKDYEHYTPRDLTALDLPLFRKAESTWAEKWKNIDDGVANLPEPLQSEARDRLRALDPVEPERAGLRPHAAGAEIKTAHWVLALDPKTGAIQKLRAKSTGREWASADHPLALFTYQTLSKADFDRYYDDYVLIQAPWSRRELGKPNIEKVGAQHREWTPALAGCWSGQVEGGYRLLAELRIDDAEAQKSGLVAWPGKIFLDLLLPENEPVVKINFLCFDKAANRLPEALWLSFLPQAPNPKGWMLEKVDRWVSPFEVIRGGNRQMHAVSSAVRYQDAQGSFSIETLDAPVVALGEKLPIYYSPAQPDITKGIHFSLFNNTWGTNYVQWFGEDTRFRFVLRA